MKSKLIYLLTAYQCVESILNYTLGYELADFLDDSKTQDAVIRNLDVLGQILDDLGLETLQINHPTVDWARFRQVKNLVSYRTLGQDNKVKIWEISRRQQIVPIKMALEDLLAAIDNG
ncbi:DUF86 domain-containing protein [Methylosoma difficile]